MADLILPGTISGLLRVCSLVAVVGGAFAGRKGVIVDLERGARRAVVALQADATHDSSVEWLALADLALILTDATGRAHAAWWLAAALCVLEPCFVVWTRRGSGWTLWSPAEPERSDDREIPSLADLDSEDGRRLPDGFRWVDAEALRRVVLHFVGVSLG